MRTKLIMSTETSDTEYWSDLSPLPQIHEWPNVCDILKHDEIGIIKQSANCWSGVIGTIES